MNPLNKKDQKAADDLLRREINHFMGDKDPSKKIALENLIDHFAANPNCSLLYPKPSKENEVDDNGRNERG